MANKLEIKLEKCYVVTYLDGDDYTMNVIHGAYKNTESLIGYLYETFSENDNDWVKYAPLSWFAFGNPKMGFRYKDLHDYILIEKISFNSIKEMVDKLDTESNSILIKTDNTTMMITETHIRMN